jgi:hypothetical protein
MKKERKMEPYLKNETRIFPKEFGKQVVSGWLYGWKDIAGYIGCDVCTVRKYVAKSKLPIHRLPETKKPIASPLEIDRWIKNLKKPQF